MKTAWLLLRSTEMCGGFNAKINNKKKNANTTGRKRRLKNIITDNSPGKRSSTSLKHSAVRTYLNSLLSFPLPPDLCLKGWEKGPEERRREKSLALRRQKEKRREETLTWDCPPVDSGSLCEAVGGEELVGMGWSQHIWLTGEWSCRWDQGYQNKMGRKKEVLSWTTGSTDRISH